MNKLRVTLNAFALVILTLMVSSMAHAQASRTWVSGVGDDVNPCSRTAPCKTFAGAISKTADGGEINAIDPGGFGAVTITKGMTIDGAGTMASILASLTNGVIINDTTNTKFIRIRNVSINGAGNGVNGIRILTGKTFTIENVEISGFTTNGIDAPLSSVASGGSQLYVYNTNISRLLGVSSIGIKLSAPASFFTATLDQVRVARAKTGLQAGSQSFVIAQNSMFTGGTTGIEMVNGVTARLTLESSNLSNNSVGLSAGSGTTSFLSQNSITQCSTGISSGGGVVQSSGNNRILGNTADGPAPTIINPK